MTFLSPAVQQYASASSLVQLAAACCSALPEGGGGFRCQPPSPPPGPGKHAGIQTLIFWCFERTGGHWTRRPSLVRDSQVTVADDLRGSATPDKKSLCPVRALPLVFFGPGNPGIRWSFLDGFG
mmetsp:Transcript_153174/g.267640  ORF Transcript_153174/g.267640 Transcript_153174/m.267640 type:complete len:124 (+) Transcript_153174:2509-2880(+)